MAEKRTAKIFWEIFCYLILFIVLLDMNACLISSGRVSFFWNPLFDICFCPRYSEVMEIPVEGNGTVVPCKLYRRNGAPFLLVGPYPFLKDTPDRNGQSDFFFVGRNHILGRGLGCETKDWTLKFKRVWIWQDLDPNEGAPMVPAYNFRETRVQDPANGNICFTVTCEGDEKGPYHYTFSIPKHLIDALPEYREKRP